MNNFALLDAEDNTFGPLNSGGIAGLSLLGTLSAISGKQKSFVLLADAGLVASRTLL